MPATRDEAIAYLARLKACRDDCEKAGFIGAVLDNERMMVIIKRWWGIA
jgi:hypothetical protein